MSHLIRGLSRGLLLVFVVGALGLGAHEALSSTTPATACDQAGQIGSCPPFDDTSCDNACKQQFDTGGACAPDGCCTCMI